MRINFLFALFLSLLLTTPNAYCENIQQTEKQLYPDYANMFLGKDKFEKFNRKMFKFNLKMNKYVLKPVHVVWASVMPKYGMDRIQSMYSNIEYPKRAISTILQRDFKSLGHETVRFLTAASAALRLRFKSERDKSSKAGIRWSEKCGKAKNAKFCFPPIWLTAAAAPVLFRRIRGWCLKSKFWTLPNSINKNPSYKARVFIFTLNSRQNSNRKTDRRT